MRQMFVLRVKEKETELKEAEREVSVLRLNVYERSKMFFIYIGQSYVYT